jgi:hypothetical protein
MKILQGFPPVLFLIVATLLETCGDGLIRKGIYNHAGAYRIGFFIVGAILLFGYGSFLNLAPLEFGQVVGLYIATLFVMWQVINLCMFHTRPSMPSLVGGTLVVAGGLIITYWKPA